MFNRLLGFKSSEYLPTAYSKIDRGHRQICHIPRDRHMEQESRSVHPNSVAFDNTSLSTTRAPRQPLAFF